MENSSQKEEYKPEDMLLYNTNYNLCQQEEIDGKDSISMKSCNENDDSIQNGRWSDEEHIRFIKGCLFYANNWKKIKKYVRTRSSAQIRSHAQKYLIKLNKKYPSWLQNESKKKDDIHYLKSNDSSRSNNYIDSEVITQIINSLNTTNIDMESVERAILARFKFNGKNKPFQTIAIDDLNIKSEYSSSNNNNEVRKNKGDIFSLIKVAKSRREEEIRRMKYNRENYINDACSTDDQINYNHNLTQYQCKDNKTFELETFIHSCLNSHDPNELTKLLTKLSNGPLHGGGITDTTSNNSSFFNYNDNAKANSNDAQRNAGFTNEHLITKDNCFSLNYNQQRDYFSYFNYQNVNEIFDNSDKNLFPSRNAYMNTKNEGKKSLNGSNVSQGQADQLEGHYIMDIFNDNNGTVNPARNLYTQKPENNNSNSIDHQVYNRVFSRTNYHYPFNIIYYKSKDNNQSHSNTSRSNPIINAANSNSNTVRHQSAFTHHSSLNDSQQIIGSLYNQTLTQNTVNDNNRIFKAYHY